MKNYQKITAEVIRELSEIIPAEMLFDSEEQREKYAHDETEDLMFLPELVVKPQTVEQISRLMDFCNRKLIPVTPRGAGTGLSGGALPVEGGILLSMERFNKIIEIDEQNLQATVEPGVINQVFQEAVAEKGLYYPPDPSSRGSSMLGGNVAHNSGGPHAVKYGVTRDYVLNLEVVLPTGEVIWTGANTLKNSTGYSLTHLMIGNEGTLGIITKIVFKLIPLPKHNVLMLVPFGSSVDACAAVSAIFRKGIIPSALEFMERDAIEWTMRFVQDTVVKLEEGVQAHLLIELDGNEMDILMNQAAEIAELLNNFNAGEPLFADTENQKAALWKLRRSVGEAVKSHSVYKEEDTVVKRAELPRLLAGVKEIGSRYGFRSVCYGHAGDGNLHVNIIKGEMADEKWQNELPKAISEIFSLCKELGGTISGEHGIGWVQKNYLPIVFNDKQLDIQRQIKSLFDPNNILNPLKIFP
jgi:glycolate oxidase